MSKKIIFDKKIAIVVGGAGFIGSNLCEELLKTSKVICIDNFVSGDERNIDHLLAESDFEFIKHDLCEPINLDVLPELQKFKIRFQGVQEIYNVACPMSARNYSRNVIKTLLANSLLVKNVLDMALHYDADLLHFSSSVVYGPRTVEQVKFDEKAIVANDFLSMRSALEEGKRFAETMIINYQRETGVRAKIVRPFNIYGPHMPLGDGHIIADFIDKALEHADIVINGDEETKTSFCYVSDLIDACQRIINLDSSGPYNVGSDVDVRLSELARKIVTILESRSQIVFAPPIEPLTPYSLPVISLARDHFSWLPIIPLEKGLRETIKQLKANKGIKDIRSAVAQYLEPEDGK